MPIPLAVQLYSVREALAEDFAGVVTRIAQMGYLGVEPIFDLPGTTLAEAAELFKALDLAVPSAHVPLPLGADQARVLEYMGTFGSPRIVSMKGPDDFQTLDLVKRACDEFNEADAIARSNGMTLGIHNHWWEFETVEGRVVLDVMLERLSPEIFFEIDAYWVKVAGHDPAAWVQKLGERATLIHVKDGPAANPREPMVAVGTGTLDYPTIIHAAEPHTAWLIVEFDRCATDILKAIDQSYHYLTDNNLAHGRT